MRISIIVPTLNEAKYLPRLLDSLDRQSVRPHEIIVADGFSADQTRTIAANRNCIVVDGPDHPGTGRNRGAAVATGELLIFIDADIVLPDGYLEDFLAAFTRAGAVCATGVYAPLEGTRWQRFCHGVGNLFMYVLQGIRPLAAGYFLAIRHDTFAALGGFDETLLLCEDHDLAGRAARTGRFRVFWLELRTSTRRYQEQGGLALARLYLAATAKTLLGKKIRRGDQGITYPFGKHG